jgi:TonB family protein
MPEPIVSVVRRLTQLSVSLFVGTCASLLGVTNGFAQTPAAGENCVLVACQVDVDGTTSNCRITSNVTGPAFGDAALKFVRGARYAPARHNGVAVARDHAWRVCFKQDMLKAGS